MDTSATTAGYDYAFGPFRLRREERCVLAGDASLRLGSRAFDLLLALLERAGEIVGHRELTAKVWPSTVVEETSLRVQLSALRRALGDGQNGSPYIANVPGRGYCFVAPVVRGRTDAAERAEVAEVAASHYVMANPSRSQSRMIGRGQALAAIQELLRNHRMVTIAGPGGIGKTTLARVVIEEHAAGGTAENVFVDLTSIGDGSQLCGALAGALDVSLSAQDPQASLVQFLHGRNILVVLDNCEQVTDAVASLADLLLSRTSVRILATSREPLNVDAEWTYRLAPLGMPPHDQTVTAEQATLFPAVALLVRCVRAAGAPEFDVTEENVADICALIWRLDGSPLAVELVGARLPTLGLREINARLVDDLPLPLRGRRTAAPRHQTLGATLEWSYQLLSPIEQTVLGRLSVFRSVFDLDVACGVAGDEQLSRTEALQSVLSLVSKSLVSTDQRNDPPEYRLLDITRAFAMQKMREAGDANAVQRRHALEMQKKLTVADADYDAMSRAPWRAAYGGQIADIRAALDWCFSSDGDLQIGIQVMVNALPLHELGLLAEQAERIERALAYLRNARPQRLDLELRLNLKLTWPSLEPDWRGQPTLAILSRGMALAERIGDSTSRIGALYCTWLGAFVAGDYASAAKAAMNALQIAEQSRDQAGVVLADRLLAQCHHFIGDHGAARRLAELTLNREPFRLPTEYASAVPRRVSMQLVLARILWLEGLPDSAMRMADECLALADKAHFHAQLQTLGFAVIPIAIWRGDFEVARTRVTQMRTLARKGRSPYWGSWAESFAAVLDAIHVGSSQAHSPQPVPLVQTINAKELDCMASVAQAWHHPASVNRLNSDACGWCSAEILRKQAEYVLRRPGPDEMEAAERDFKRSIAIARSQGALSWELRASMSLARLWAAQGSPERGREVVSSVYERFGEGFDTLDLRTARAFLGP